MTREPEGTDPGPGMTGEPDGTDHGPGEPDGTDHGPGDCPTAEPEGTVPPTANAPKVVPPTAEPAGTDRREPGVAAETPCGADAPVTLTAATKVWPTSG